MPSPPNNMTEEYYWNHFAWPVTVDGSHVVFLTDQRRVLEVDATTFELVRANRGRRIDGIGPAFTEDLLRTGLARAEPESEQVRRVFSAGLAQQGRYQLLHIITSYACNLACSYCFMLRDLRGPKRVLNFDEARSAIDLFFSLPHVERPVVHFYGGEPLLHVGLIEQCLTYAAEVGDVPVAPKIITNGTLWSARTSELLHRYDWDLSVSLDGDRAAQDVFRLDRKGRSSFDAVIAGIESMRADGLVPKLLLTVGAHNIDRLPEIVDFMCELRPAGIALNFPRALPASENGLDDAHTRGRYWIAQYERALERCYEHGIPELYFADVLWSFLGERSTLRPCSACGAQISVGPGGVIGPCQAFVASDRFAEPLERFDTGPSDPVFGPWRDVNKVTSARCSSCPIAPICAGDCPFDRFNSTGNLREPLDFHCAVRHAMARILLTRLVQGRSLGFAQPYALPRVSEVA